MISAGLAPYLLWTLAWVVTCSLFSHVAFGFFGLDVFVGEALFGAGALLACTGSFLTMVSDL